MATVLALVFDDYASYENFLLLLASVFVPLFGAFLVDYYVVRRGRWNVSETSPARWHMLVPWIAGFITYQLVNPGYVSWWSGFWVARQHDLGGPPPSWTSASVLSFLVAAALTLAIGRLSPSPSPSAARSSRSSAGEPTSSS